MLTNTIMFSKKIYTGTLALLLLCSYHAQTQTVWEDHRAEVYQYLNRMAQKGIIRFNDNIRPLSRMYIGACLDSLQLNSNTLSQTERNELDFYLQEYSDRKILNNASESSETIRIFKKDAANRWRAFAASGKNFLVRVDPIFSASTIQGSGKNIQQYSNGFKLYGYAGSRWAFYFAYNDVVERGSGIDTTRQDVSTPGIVTKIASNKKSHNYSELRGGVSYGWKNGSISLAQERLLWGYGENGRMILSDKAPSYPQIRLDYQPLSWLNFHYTHAWLNSNVIDSNASYNTGIPTFGGRRDVYVAKYLAIHSVQLTPIKGLTVNIGESVVYSDRIQLGYLIPILFFKAYDNLINNNNINAGANSQLFVQVMSRNHLPKTQLYGSLFIDEIQISSLFDQKKSRNHIGVNIGGSVTDVVVPYLTLGAEYTRINPFVYRNLQPSQHYTSDGYVLGDWMGNNADRFLIHARYTPASRLKCLLRYQQLRKGSAGTLDQQYFQQPQPKFLFEPVRNQTEWFTQVSYEWINNLHLQAHYQYVRTRNLQTAIQQTASYWGLGFSYGL